MTNHPNRSKIAKQVRAYVLSGSAERVRIMADGAVHAYGVMPNTNQTGWYFAGWLEDVAAEAAEAAKMSQE